MPVFQIYVLTCLPTGKQYVGLTSKTTERRFKEHLKESFGTNPKLVRYVLRCAIREYGRDASGAYDAMDKSKPEHVRAAISATKTGVPRPEYLGDKNPAKRADVREKMSASAKLRHARQKAARELV